MSQGPLKSLTGHIQLIVHFDNMSSASGVPFYLWIRDNTQKHGNHGHCTTQVNIFKATSYCIHNQWYSHACVSPRSRTLFV